MGTRFRSWIRWTQEEDAKLFTLIGSGHYIHEIANEMAGRTERSVRNRIYNNQYLCDAYKEASQNRSHRGRQARVSAAPPVTKVATASAIFSIATFVLVLFVIA